MRVPMFSGFGGRPVFAPGEGKNTWAPFWGIPKPTLGPVWEPVHFHGWFLGAMQPGCRPVRLTGNPDNFQELEVPHLAPAVTLRPGCGCAVGGRESLPLPL